MSGDPTINVGRTSEWNPEGLKELDVEITALARHHARSEVGALSLRWFLLDLVTQEPVPSPFHHIDELLQEAESSFWTLFDRKIRSRKGHLNDSEIGWLLGFASDKPIKKKEWKRLREVIFSRIGLDFGPKPDPRATPGPTFDIGSDGAWRYDTIRVLDGRLWELCAHHAATDVGAETIRWHVWTELTASPRPISLKDIEAQLENAEASLMAAFSEEVRRARGHLTNEDVGRMLGFRTARPIEEGYYRQLRETVFERIAHSFGVVDPSEIPPRANAIDVGRQGAWNEQNLIRLDRELAKLGSAWAKSTDGGQTLRWHLLEEITVDPEPVDLVVVEQRLKKLLASPLNLFATMTKKGKGKLSNAKVARFADLPDADAVADGQWKKIRQRVTERVDLDVFIDDLTAPE